jgi:hypothetical protein
MEGVVRLPSLLGITTGSLPSITATHELVVPRSIPIILLMLFFLKLVNIIHGKCTLGLSRIVPIIKADRIASYASGVIHFKPPMP